MKILRGPSNEDLFRALEGFPDLAHDDQEVDACSGVLETLNPAMKGWATYELRCTAPSGARSCSHLVSKGMTVVAAERSGRRWLPD